MARKQLIKGANAAAVEARISRVPADLDAAPSIFSALKAMEAEAPASEKPVSPIVGKAAGPTKPRTAKRPAAKRAPTRAKAPGADEAPGAGNAPIAKPEAPVARAKAEIPDRPRPSRLGPSDFTKLEREAILRCCTDYRNHLPTYLLAVQREVEIIDSVIEKCQATE
jgi:hypothetical protein